VENECWRQRTATAIVDAGSREPAQAATRTKFNWRTREWYPALEAAGIERRGPYHLRHTFATEALASGISIFELSRVMGASVKEIDRTYGHLARDSEDAIRARLEARSGRSGVEVASDDA
jgi:integrase